MPRAKKEYRPPDYFSCRRRLNRLKRFQDLIRHRDPFGVKDAQYARPLLALIPPETPKHEYHRILDRQINQLAPLVYRDLALAGVETTVGYSYIITDDLIDEKGELAKPRRVEEDRDLVLHYASMQSHLGTYHLLMRALDQGIGIYSAMQRTALIDLFNPLMWIAGALRLPFYVLERAGLASEETPSQLVNAYAWLVRLAMFGLIALVLTKLGISFPWKEAIDAILKWVLKS